MDTPEIINLRGFASAPFEGLADVFARLSASGGGEMALAIYGDGKLVADLSTTGYGGDPRQLLFSVSKAVAAIAAAIAHDEGSFDIDAPISDVWPEFARRSTSSITTRHILTHSSGLAAVSSPFSVEDMLSGRIETILERMDPLWEPGTDHGYHGVTFGPLTGGVFRRGVGTDLKTFISDRLSKPLGLDLELGVPAECQKDVFPLKRLPPAATALQASPPFPLISCAAAAALMADVTVWNRSDVIESAWPASNVVAGARDLARLFAATMGPVDGVRVLSQEGLSEMVAVRKSGLDRVLGVPTRFGSGVQLPFPQFPLLGPGSFGHEGASGCFAFGDTEYGVSVGFVTDAFPRLAGASVPGLALLPTILHCLQYE